MRRALVTGAAGFIGSHLCEALLDRGWEVVGLDGFVDSYSRDAKLANLAGLRDRAGFTLREADLRTDPLEPYTDGIEAVINAAAMAGLARSWRDIDAYISCNIAGVQRLVEACKGASVRRFIQISTSSVYGENAVGDESMPTRPVSPYGVTKLAAEHLVLAHRATDGLPAVILRYFSVYGPRQRPDMAYYLFIEAMLERRSITVFGDGSQSRSNTFVTDCVNGTIAAIEHAEEGEIYNIGGGHSVTINEAISLIGKLLGVRPNVLHQDALPGDQRHTAADIAKARRAFGFNPTTSPVDGLRAQVAWHRARRASESG